jgi:hypothetical protein
MAHNPLDQTNRLPLKYPRSAALSLLLLLLLVLVVGPTQAQTALCGVVDTIRLPIDNPLEINNAYDDFALYRSRFGGRHTGFDMAFDRWGDPVYAAANGLVTYADLEAWDTEKGVVIVEHTFPDGSIAYSLYGHVEQTNEINLPQAGQCVRAGDVVGAVGWPSRGRPHLHYEIRNFGPDEGGPGYVDVNPQTLGWYHPLDFTSLWNARLQASVIGYSTALSAPTQPPLLSDANRLAVAINDIITSLQPPSTIIWQTQTNAEIVGLGVLSGDRIVTRSRSGLITVLGEARYQAAWQLDGPDAPLVIIRDQIYSVGTGEVLHAFDAAGTLLWRGAAEGGVTTHFSGDGQGQLLHITRDGLTHRWRVLAWDTGAVLAQGSAAGVVIGGSARGADGSTLWTLYGAGTGQSAQWWQVSAAGVAQAELNTPFWTHGGGGGRHERRLSG